MFSYAPPLAILFAAGIIIFLLICGFVLARLYRR